MIIDLKEINKKQQKNGDGGKDGKLYINKSKNNYRENEMRKVKNNS